jgi:hypothetical protein
MPLSIADMQYLKPATVTNGNTNGGRMNESQVIVSGATNNLFDRITEAERVAGLTRYRKFFIANRNAADLPGYSGLFCSKVAPDGGDRVYVSNGTQRDTAVDLTGFIEWVGAGTLAQPIQAADEEIQVAFRANDYEVPNARAILITNGTTTDFATTAHEGITDEVVGTGQSSYSVTLATTPIDKASLVISYLISSTPYTATDDGLGIITGTGITSASIDYATGDLSITGSTTLLTVTATYAKQCFTWTGNTATITLAGQVANAYATNNTNVGVCIFLTQLAPTADSKIVTSGTGGTFDLSAVALENRGTVEDDFTITFTGATAFTISGLYEGALQTGSVNSEYAPLNPRTTRPLVTIPVAAWGGTFASGNTVAFSTHPAALGIWIKNIIPAGTSGAARDTDTGYLFVE